MYYTIYKITNMIDGKFYIGKHQTPNLGDGYMGSGKRLKNAIKKHGIENFKKEILEVFSTEEEMNAAEARLVVLGPDSYNLCPGGQGGFGFIRQHEDYKKWQNKAANAGALKLKEKYPNGVFFGKNHTEESKLKMSKIKKLQTNIGRPHTDEAKAKISASTKITQSGSRNS